ncbi:MAG: carboxypeptidase regulatory-like domain-containing protein [Deltaproteobacteria bacterium]|nr:carboxypeptidase regulatory-like domain-containing protein [Deltaproteobacteria bacterium]
MVAVGIAVILAACAVQLGSQGGTDPAIRIGENDLGGVVTSANGPEAGVWVIAETTDLPTKFAKIVVTDDRGRYVMPDLPKASYSVWVRGYGLVDSAKVRTAPGKILNLTAVLAPNEKQAAQYYPAMYWYSLLKVPEKREFPMRKIKSQGEWLNIVKSGACNSCHGLGTPGMRTIPKELGEFKSSGDAWRRRLMSGQAQMFMLRDINRLDTERALAMFADWTDRIAAGELPFAKPERPKGIERNLVVSLWDWASPTTYLHDVISTDRRNPRVNANGKIYGSAEDSTDMVPILDPVTHTVTEVKHPVRDPKTPSSKANAMAPSPYWGAEPIWDSQTLNHNPMMDEKGRVWFTARIRPPANPDYCKKGSDHPSAKVFPLESSNRNLSIYDPATGKFTLISTCFPTHHLNFASNANETLWTSVGVVGPGAVGWLNRKMYEETGDEVKAQGWTPFILDTNGNGKRDAYVEPDRPVDPAKDKRAVVNLYSVAISPADGSVWGTSLGYPGHVVRVNPGPDPTHTAITEIYEPPFPGFGPRGGDIDRDGVFWVSLATGHLGSFDRRKCKVLNGPTATGKHCPEGWALHQLPGPQFRTVTDPGSAEASYYVWIDWFDTFGLGRNVPIVMGSLNDAILALVDGKLLTLRVPYPMGFFPKNVDGRIDDPNAGWKGKALWTTTGTRTPFLMNSRDLTSASRSPARPRAPQLGYVRPSRVWAIASTISRMSNGRRATWTVLRAGSGPLPRKNRR